MAHSKISIYAALGANAAIAVIKFIAASVTGSSSMLSEGIHSTVDSANQMLLLLGINRSKRQADETHPFGHGQELYFWALIVSVLIFGLGGGMSVYEGILHIQHPEELSDPTWNYAVLGAAMVFEGISFFIAVRSFRKKKGSGRFLHKLLLSKDPSLFVVIFEDAAALAGLLIAFSGVFFSHYFNMPELDGLASIIIGAVLALVAVVLIIESRNLLIGESAHRETVDTIYNIIRNDKEIVQLRRPLTMQLSPDEILLALDVEFKSDLNSKQLVKAICRLEQNIKERLPDVKQIYIEARNISESEEEKETLSPTQL